MDSGFLTLGKAVGNYFKSSANRRAQTFTSARLMSVTYQPDVAKGETTWEQFEASRNILKRFSLLHIASKRFSHTCASLDGGISFRERLEYRVGSVLVELDADLSPKIVGKVIQLPAGGDGHEECLCLLIDREFGDAGNHYFHPPSALHEPFARLLATSPSIGLRLITKLTNHATTGWRQIHKFRRRERGSPIPVVLEFP